MPLLESFVSSAPRPLPVRSWGIFLVAVLVVTGCDTSVEALVPSDEYHYSVFGVLNPVQDTQWVRVEPLAEPTSSGAPESIDAEVSLENLDTGQTWVLRDSLMEVFRDEFQHNFWTTAPISPGTSYELTVRGAEGETTHAATTTPERPPAILVESAIQLPCSPVPEANRFEVTIEEVEELAALRMVYYQSPFGPTEVFDFDHYDDVEQTSGGYAAFINYFEDLQSARRTRQRTCLADSAKVVAASGGPDWPEWARYRGAPLSQVARPDSFSNVEGGHGLLAGVYPDTVAVPIEREAQP